MKDREPDRKDDPFLGEKLIGEAEGISITSQKQMLTQFAEYHGIEIVETYVDDGWSGTNFERPDFKRMIADIESGSCKQSYPQFHEIASYTHSHNADYYGISHIPPFCFMNIKLYYLTK